MKTTSIWVSLLSGIILSSQAYAQAQQYWYVPHQDEAKTPIELKLESPELAMPGFGIGSSRTTLLKRFQYATEHKWLASQQVDQLCNDMKKITDKESSMRDADGKLNYEARASLARQLNELNDKFEELVLVREQSNPGIEGLQAREALMIQRVNLAVSQGKMTAKKAAEMKAEIRQTMAEVPEKDLSDEQSKQIASNLNKISGSLEKDLRGPSMASRLTPFAR